VIPPWSMPRVQLDVHPLLD